MKLLAVTVSLLPFLLIAQQRISIDANTRLNTINFTARYMKVFKKPFLISGGICFGHYGTGANAYDSIDVINRRNESPFNGLDDVRVDTSGTYDLTTYNAGARGVGIDLGFGVYHEFSITHGLRFNINQRFMIASDKVTGYYKDWSAQSVLVSRVFQYHFAGAVVPELYHTVRIGGRSTFYYGLKAPYYFTLNKKKYHPVSYKDVLYGFEPELSFGITYQVGNCD